MLAQIEQTIPQTHERGTELAVVGGDPLEALPLRLERVAMDLEQASSFDSK